jgi:hypothetical protein
MCDSDSNTPLWKDRCNLATMPHTRSNDRSHSWKKPLPIVLLKVTNVHGLCR